MLIAAAVSCKSPNRTASRSGRAGSGMGGPTSGKPSEWVTPYNLVDINAATQEPTKVTLIGDIERITLDNPADVFTSGVIEMSGVRVVIPANLIIDAGAAIHFAGAFYTSACKVQSAKSDWSRVVR